MRVLGVALVMAVLGGASAAAAAPLSGLPSASPMKPILVQGWWDRDPRRDELRERYSRLPPPERARYDQIQAEINELGRRREFFEREGRYDDARGAAARMDDLTREQYRLLQWGEYQRPEPPRYGGPPPGYPVNEASREWQERVRTLDFRGRDQYGQLERRIVDLAREQERTGDMHRRVAISDEIHQLRAQQAGLLGLNYRP